MNNYIVVWSINQQSIDWTFVLIPFFVGLVFLIVEIYHMIDKNRNGFKEFNSNSFFSNGRRNNSLDLGGLLIGIIGIAWGCYNFYDLNSTFDEAISETKKTEVQIAEGSVEVMNEQPGLGHSKGDVIKIGNCIFEINYFITSYFYHQSIRHGGILKNGVKVRVKYLQNHNNEMLFFGAGKIFEIETIQ